MAHASNAPKAAMVPMTRRRRSRIESTSRSHTSANNVFIITSLNANAPSGRTATSPAYTSRSLAAPRSNALGSKATSRVRVTGAVVDPSIAFFMTSMVHSRHSTR